MARGRPRTPRVMPPDELAQHGRVEQINGVVINYGGSPLRRWIGQGVLSDTQRLAIDHCLRLWDWAGIPMAPVTAGYGERIGGDMEDPEHVANRKIDAADDLKRVSGYVPTAYWRVFENCIRYDMPAGVLTSDAVDWNDRTAPTKALTIVQFVADVICMNEKLARW